mmetsp:Transcript_46175/g.82459  ORF Transcript_46175/g.82459 Transcript_46175/m.82459 type:complete len:115 (-) Transcript_46175:83-427(-)
MDTDVPATLVYPSIGMTTESSMINRTASFHTTLATMPYGNVVIVESTADTEGEASPVTLTFTPSDWNLLQTFEVRFANDDMPDGDITYHVNLTPWVVRGTKPLNGLPLPWTLYH